MAIDVNTASMVVLGCFSLRVRDRVVHASGALERLLIYLCLEAAPRPRLRVAGTLWPDRTDGRAGANLRNLLWRLSAISEDLVVCDADRLQLSPTVTVDLHQCREYIATIRSGGIVPRAAVGLLAADLVPDSGDDWVVAAREQHRQQRLYALEELCRRATAAGRYDVAVEAGLAAVSSDPLRASSHRALIAAHLAEQNVGEAYRQLDAYGRALDEAGLAGADELRRMREGLQMADRARSKREGRRLPLRRG